VTNTSFNLTTVKADKTLIEDRAIVALSIRKDKATALSLTAEATAIQVIIDAHDTEKTAIAALS